MKIKKITEKYLNEIVLLEKELFNDAFDEKSFKSEFAEKNRSYFGLFKDDVLIGYIGVMIVLETADIIKIGISKNEQGKGFGKNILSHLLCELKKINVKQVFLEVAYDNVKAINMYTSVGFVNMGVRKNYYIKDNKDAIILKMEI